MQNSFFYADASHTFTTETGNKDAETRIAVKKTWPKLQSEHPYIEEHMNKFPLAIFNIIITMHFESIYLFLQWRG